MFRTRKRAVRVKVCRDEHLTVSIDCHAHALDTIINLGYPRAREQLHNIRTSTARFIASQHSDDQVFRYKTSAAPLKPALVHLNALRLLKEAEFTATHPE